MRPQLLKSSFALLLTIPYSFSISANAADWNGSYAANGQCFCAGAAVNSAVGGIFPTPIGGQTIAQICQRLGEGPGLEKNGGLFNYPVYSDPQCGHGPFSQSESAHGSECVGSLDGLGSEGCVVAGPVWNIKKAYAQSAPEKDEDIKVPKPVSAKAEEVVVESPVDTASEKLADKGKPSASSLLTQPVVTSVSVDNAKREDGGQSKLRATVISSASTAGRKLPKRDALAPFAGRVINIDGRRYLQAKDGLSATGGKPGTRIVVDGLVYLKDDGTIKPTDLYRVQPKKNESARRKQNDTSQVTKDDVRNTVQQKSALLRSINPQQSGSKADRALNISSPIDSARGGTANNSQRLKTNSVIGTAGQLAQQDGLAPTDKNALDLSLVEEPFIVGNTSVVDNSNRNSVDRVPAHSVLEPMTVDAASLNVSSKNVSAAASRANSKNAVPRKPQSSSTLALVNALPNDSGVESEVSIRKAIVEKAEILSENDAKPNTRLAELPKSAQPEAPQLAAAVSSDSIDASVAEKVIGEELSSNIGDSAQAPVTVVSALKLPETATSRDEKFAYLEATPASYDIGGGGVVLKGSAESHSKFHYLGRVGVADTYQEVRLGGGYYITPASANRLTVVLEAGVEHGIFNLNDEQDQSIAVDFSDTGLFVGAATQLALSQRFTLKGGVGYSSFFEGDPAVFGGAYWQISRQVDLVSSFELGDNDLFGLGVRFYY